MSTSVPGRTNLAPGSIPGAYTIAGELPPSHRTRVRCRVSTLSNKITEPVIASFETVTSKLVRPALLAWQP
jgi:hypothetical protein